MIVSTNNFRITCDGKGCETSYECDANVVDFLFSDSNICGYLGQTVVCSSYGGVHVFYDGGGGNEGIGVDYGGVAPYTCSGGMFWIVCGCVLM